MVEHRFHLGLVLSGHQDVHGAVEVLAVFQVLLLGQAVLVYLFELDLYAVGAVLAGRRVVGWQGGANWAGVLELLAAWLEARVLREAWTLP